MNLHYWQYFAALEADLAATARFVELASANMACYSVEFARILLTAGSEIDVLCKVLCQEHRQPVRPTILRSLDLLFPFRRSRASFRSGFGMSRDLAPSSLGCPQKVD